MSPTSRSFKIFGVSTGTEYHWPMQLAAVLGLGEYDHIHGKRILAPPSGLNISSSPVVSQWDSFISCSYKYQLWKLRVMSFSSQCFVVSVPHNGHCGAEQCLQVQHLFWYWQEKLGACYFSKSWGIFCTCCIGTVSWTHRHGPFSCLVSFQGLYIKLKHAARLLFIRHLQ